MYTKSLDLISLIISPLPFFLWCFVFLYCDSRTQNKHKLALCIINKWWLSHRSRKQTPTWGILHSVQLLFYSFLNNICSENDLTCNYNCEPMFHHIYNLLLLDYMCTLDLALAHWSFHTGFVLFLYSLGDIPSFVISSSNPPKMTEISFSNKVILIGVCVCNVTGYCGCLQHWAYNGAPRAGLEWTVDTEPALWSQSQRWAIQVSLHRKTRPLPSRKYKGERETVVCSRSTLHVLHEWSSSCRVSIQQPNLYTWPNSITVQVSTVMWAYCCYLFIYLF